MCDNSKRAMSLDMAQEIRLLRQSLMIIRQRINEELNALDQRLAALEPEEDLPSDQIPQTSDEWIKYLES